jgi:hypothetical protein
VKLTEQIKIKYERYSAQAADLRRLLAEDAAAPALSASEKANVEWKLEAMEYSAESNRLQYMKRAYIDLATGLDLDKKATKAARASLRKCGYCRRSGHTRRTCKNLANDYKMFTIQNRKMRARQEDRINELGIGVGSLVVQKFMGYGKDDVYGEIRLAGLVTEIDLSAVRIDHCGGWSSSRDRSAYTIICKSVRELKGETLSYKSQRMRNMSIRCVESSRWESEIVPSYAKVVTHSLKDIPLAEAFPSTGTDSKRAWRYHQADAEQWITESRATLGIPMDAYADS